MAFVGRPPPAYGLKFLVKAGSPDPVITRHEWVARVAAGAAAVPTRRTETPTRAATAAAPAEDRMGRRLRRIRVSFLAQRRAATRCGRSAGNVPGTLTMNTGAESSR